MFLISSIEVIKLDYRHVLKYIKGSWHEHEKLAYLKLLLLLLWDLHLLAWISTEIVYKKLANKRVD